jgi:hypothetical protein
VYYGEIKDINTGDLENSYGTARILASSGYKLDLDVQLTGATARVLEVRPAAHSYIVSIQPSGRSPGTAYISARNLVLSRSAVLFVAIGRICKGPVTVTSLILCVILIWLGPETCGRNFSET